LGGLATVFLFFAGQTGYLTYVVHRAVDRGMTFEHTAQSLALMKFATGIVILLSAYLRRGEAKNSRFGYLTFILVMAILSLSYCRNIAVFFLALLVMEMALNKLSARLQAAVVAARPEFAGRWLTGVMLLGAATGPPLNGFMISVGFDGLFVLICVISAFGPLLWQQWGGSTSSRNTVGLLGNLGRSIRASLTRCECPVERQSLQRPSASRALPSFGKACN
jgi:hypothetical protein